MKQLHLSTSTAQTLVSLWGRFRTRQCLQAVYFGITFAEQADEEADHPSLYRVNGVVYDGLLVKLHDLFFCLSAVPDVRGMGVMYEKEEAGLASFHVMW